MAKIDILALTSSTNICDLLDDDKLNEIASKVLEDYHTDYESCAEYRGTIDDAMQIAKQMAEEKTTPWPGASNVLYPLIANASISFAARTYPEIIRNGKVVECAVLGADPTGEKEDRAHRISQHMSAQLLVEDPEWESDTDRLLSCLAVVGTVFKKTYWDEYEKRNRSIMCTPDDIVVHSEIKSLETARRITHKLCMCSNDIISRIRLGIFTDISDDLSDVDDDSDDDNDTVLEQHCYFDLDDDGYAEPYVVTVHEQLNKVLRIYRRWDPENIFVNAKDEIWRIDPVHYFTDFHFMRSPDGKYYGIGFGQLLLPINDTINSCINQLIDSGTLYNMKTGYVSREFKVKSGSQFATPGELKKTDCSADVLQKGIFMLPVGEPSTVLFQLLGVMIDTGKELASVSDIMQGQQPAQNVPATTVLALIEQGMKVFSSIQKRMYNSLKKEFGKLFRLNRLHLEDTQEYKQVMSSMIINKDDYTDQDMSVVPVSDPSMSSDAQRLARARALMEILPQVPAAGGQVILRQWLEALQTPDAMISKILPPPDPNAPPSPEQIKMQMEQQKQQLEIAEVQAKMNLQAHELDLKQQQTQINASQIAAMNQESQARIQKMFLDSVLAKEKLGADTKQNNIELAIRSVETAQKAQVSEAKVDIEAKKVDKMPTKTATK